MFKKVKMPKNINYSDMYKNSLDPTDIVNCYFSVLSQVKGCSYTGQQYNYIDMYNNFSSIAYGNNSIYDNEIK